MAAFKENGQALGDTVSFSLGQSRLVCCICTTGNNQPLNNPSTFCFESVQTGQNTWKCSKCDLHHCVHAGAVNAVGVTIGPQCDYRTPIAWNMTLHLVVHQRGDPTVQGKYKCKEGDCKAMYARSDTLSRHKKTAHGPTVLSWLECKKAGMSAV